MRTTSINRFAFAALLCCGMFLLYSNARAQCPDNTGPAPDPATCPWTSASTYYLYPGTTCDITVYYCWRICSGIRQVYVTEVDPDAISACDGIDPSIMIYDARDAAVQDALANLNVALCIKGGDSTVVTTYSPACWVAFSKPSGGIKFSICSNWGCFCQRTCEVCYEGGAAYSISCTNSGAPSCDCYNLDANLPSTNHEVVIGACYRLLCN